MRSSCKALKLIAMNATFEVMLLIRRIFVIVLFVFSVARLQGQSILFEISKPGIAHKSYVMGTIHLHSQQVFCWNDSVFDCMKRCDKALFEVSFDEMENPKLDTTVKDSIYQIFADLVSGFMKIKEAAKVGTDSNRTKDAKMEELLKNVIETPDSLYRKHFMDQFLATWFYSSKHIKPEGIETLNSQLRKILEIHVDSTLQNFLQMVAMNDSLPNKISGIFDLLGKSNHLNYTSLDIQNLQPLFDTLFSLPFYIYHFIKKSLIEERNIGMWKRLDVEHQQQPTFCAVGEAHLIAEKGILQSLRNAGYQVRPVNVKIPYKNPASRLEFKKTRELGEFGIAIPENSTVQVSNSSDSSYLTHSYPFTSNSGEGEIRLGKFYYIKYHVDTISEFGAQDSMLIDYPPAGTDTATANPTDSTFQYQNDSANDTASDSTDSEKEKNVVFKNLKTGLGLTNVYRNGYRTLECIFEYPDKGYTLIVSVSSDPKVLTTDQIRSIFESLNQNR